MATTHTLTGNIADLGFDAFAASKITAWIELANVDDDTFLNVDDNTIVMGSYPLTIESDGSWSQVLPATGAGAGYDPDGGYYYELCIDARGSVDGIVSRFRSQSFGLTADSTIVAALEGTIELTAVSATEWADFTARYDEIVALGVTNDSITAANIEDEGSDTYAALSATIANRLGADTGVPSTEPTAFVANGTDNVVAYIPTRSAEPFDAHVEGHKNSVYGWYGHAEGQTSMVDGKIGHAEGNTTICSANDSHSEGNRTATGRRYYDNITFGSEDAGGGLGTLQYVLLPAADGDVTSYFPNPLTDNVTTRYGAGAQKGTKGEIYHSSHTPAVWTGAVPTTVNDLEWAMHPVCILRGATNESAIAFATIAKAVYSGGQTKVYYTGAKPFTTLIGIYTSYAPLLLDAGNGQHSEGLFTSTWGYGAHSEGENTRAWARGAHSEGMNTKATGAIAPHAEGFQTKATGDYGAHSEGRETTADGDSSHAEGWESTANGIASHAEGYDTLATGDYGAHAEGESTVASGLRSHAEGRQTTASGQAAHAEGYLSTAAGFGAHAEGESTSAPGYASRAVGKDSLATRAYQDAYAAGKRSVLGDNQTSRINYAASFAGAGWHDVSILNNVENGSYHFETMVLGRQTAGTAGAVGHTFAYRITGAFTAVAGVATILGTTQVTLVGRSAGMTGDGLTTGVRLTAQGYYAPFRVVARLDSIADTTFWVQSHTTFQEIA